ncbi:MAG: hypothetical protein ACLRWQ_06825 [Flavonifractor plautii]
MAAESDSAEAIRHLEAQPLPPNVEPRRCDVLADTPGRSPTTLWCSASLRPARIGILSAARRQ